MSCHLVLASQQVSVVKKYECDVKMLNWLAFSLKAGQEQSKIVWQNCCHP